MDENILISVGLESTISKQLKALEANVKKTTDKIKSTFNKLKNTQLLDTKRLKKAAAVMSNGLATVGKASKKVAKTVKKSMSVISKGAKKATKTVKALTKVMTGPLGLAVAAVGLAAPIGALWKVLDDGKALERMHNNTGIAIDKLEEFRIMTVLAGGNMDNLSDAVQDFGERTGEALTDTQSSWAKAFKTMGVTLGDDLGDNIDSTLLKLAEMVDAGKKQEALFAGADLFGAEQWKNTFANIIKDGVVPFEKRLKELSELKAFDAGIIKVQERFRLVFNGLKAEAGKVLVEASKSVVPYLEGGIKTITDIVKGIDGEDIGTKVAATLDKLIVWGRDFAITLLNVGEVLDKAITTVVALFNDHTKFKVLGDVFTQSLELGAINGANIFRTTLQKAFGKAAAQGGANSLLFSGLAEGLDTDADKLARLNKEMDNVQIKFDKAAETAKKWDGVSQRDARQAGNITRYVNETNAVVKYGKELEALETKIDKLSNSKKDSAAEDKKTQLDATIALASESFALEDVTKKWEGYRTAVENAAKTLQDNVAESKKAGDDANNEALAPTDWAAKAATKYETDMNWLNDQMSVLALQISMPQLNEEKPINILEQLFGSTPEEIVSSAMTYGQNILSTVQSISNSISEIHANEDARELDRLQKKNKTEIDNFKGSSRQKNILLADQQAAEEKMKKDQFKKDKERKKKNVLIDTASAIAGGWASAMQLPYPGNIIAGGASTVASTAMGIAQVAAINSQEYGRGGILDGPSHANGGIQTPFGELEGGEPIINKKSGMMFRNELSAINEAGGGVAFGDSSKADFGNKEAPTQNIYKITNVFEGDITNDQISKLKNNLYELSNNGDIQDIFA